MALVGVRDQGRCPSGLTPRALLQLLELLQLCQSHISALVHDGELPSMASLDRLQARFGNSPPGSLSSLELMQADTGNHPHPEAHPPAIPSHPRLTLGLPPTQDAEASADQESLPSPGLGVWSGKRERLWEWEPPLSSSCLMVPPVPS